MFQIMEFVLRSARDIFIDPDEWIEKYVDHDSSMYKEYKKTVVEEGKSVRETNFVNYFYIWVDIIRRSSHHFRLESYDKKGNCINMCKDKRQIVMIKNVMPIAIIDKVGHEWKYRYIPADGLELLNSYYMMQLC